MLELSIIVIITILSLILAIVFVPEIKIGKVHLQTFWIVSVIGAILILIFGFISWDQLIKGVTNSSSMNPLKILIIFISMTVLSIVLDELGFFKKMAFIALERSKAKQIKIFLYLYATISFLTILTSNDIIILTFTPFICYFTKHAKINPIPYLISEFVAANTWSMMLVIGNPTNIYLASIYEVDFIEYFTVMVLPTMISSLGSLGILLLLFGKELKKPSTVQNQTYELKNKKMVLIALLHLGICIVLLTISSYLDMEMWLISLVFALSDLFILLIYQVFFQKRKPMLFIFTLKRAPWSLIPFLLSMFTIVLALTNTGITSILADFLNRLHPIYGYGIGSFLFANIMNNIPMTIFFADLIKFASDVNIVGAIYASIIGSNLGAFLTPIGALAGIMWIQILKREGIGLSIPKFIKYGVIVSVPTILIALTVLMLVI